MKYYGVNLKGDLTRRTDFELLGPLLGEANKSYIQSLLDYREGNGARSYHSNVVDTIQGDVIAGRDNFFPGVPPSGEQIDITSLKGLIDGGNYWTRRTNINDSRYGLTGFTGASGFGVIAGGDNGGRTNTVERYSDASNLWIYRTNLNDARDYLGSFSLTSDLGVSATGGNSSGYSSTTERYSDAGNSWTSRASCSFRRYGSGAYTLDSSYGILAGGTNGAGNYLTNVERFDDSANSWASRTAISIGRTGLGSFSQNTDNGIVAGGINGNVTGTTEQYSNSANAWTTKTSLSIVRHYLTGFSCTSESGIASGGFNDSSRLANTDKFSNSGNIWNCRSHMSSTRSHLGGFVINSNHGLCIGGLSNQEVAERFKDSSTIFDNQTTSTYKHPNAAVPRNDENQYGPNLVYNGDMELDDDTWIDFGTPSLNARDGYKFNGNYSRKLQTDGNNEGMRMADHKAMTTETGKTYKFSVMVYAQTNSNVYIQINRGGSGAQAFTYSNLNTPAWNLVEFEYYETSGGDNCIIYLISGGGAGNTYYFDDVQFREVLETRNSKDVVSTKDLSNTTDQIKHIVVTSLNQKRDPVAMNGYWTTRNPLIFQRTLHAGFGLTDDFGMVAGGWISSSYANSERHSDSGNAWVVRGNITQARSSFAGLEESSEYGHAVAGSTTGSNYVNTVDRYFDPGTTWTARTGCNISRHSHCAFKLTDNLGLMANGYNGTQALGNVERVDYSTGGWSNRTATVDNVRYSAGSAMSDDQGLVSGGLNNSSTVKNTTWRYDNNANIWTSRTTLLMAAREHDAFNVSKNEVVINGGFNGSRLVVVQKFDDSTNSMSNQTDQLDFSHHHNSINIGSSNQGLSFGGYVGVGSNETGFAQKYTDSEVASISAPTFDISLSGNDDESQDFDLRDQSFDTLIDLTGYTNTGSWSFGTAIPNEHNESASFGGIDTTKGIVAGGDNASGRLAYVDRYDTSQNAWYQRTALTEETSQTDGFGLTSNLGVMAGGYNATSYTAAVYRYNDTGNSWTSRTAMNTIRSRIMSLQLDSDKGLVSGGHNASYLSNVERHSNSGNNWTNRTSLNTARRHGAATGFTSDSGLISGGYNGTLPLHSTELYSDSGNSWTSKASIGIRKVGVRGLELDTTSGLITGGRETTTNEYYNTVLEYSLTNDTWTEKVIMLSGREMHGSLEMSSTTGIVAAGNNYLYLTSTEKYNSEATQPVLEPAGIWTSRAGCLDKPAWSHGAPLTSDSGLRTGGHNGIYSNSTYKYTDSSNGWTKRTNLSQTKYGSGAFPLQENSMLSAGGRNITTFLATTYRFDEGSNAWTSRTSMSNARTHPVGFGVNTDQGIIATGETGGQVVYVERFSESGNSWTSRTNINTGVQGAGGFKVNTDIGILNGGYNGSIGYTSITQRYSNSENLWTFRGNTTKTKLGNYGFSLKGERGLLGPGSQGVDSHNTTDRYEDSSGIWSSRATVTTYRYGYGAHEVGSGDQGIIAHGYDANSDNIDYTDRYSDGAIASTVDPAGYWTYRTDLGRRRYATTSFELTSNLGVTCAGNNGSGAQGVVDRYNDTDNTWESRTDLNTSRQDLAGWNMDSDQGIAAAGASGGYSGATERYSNSADSWTNRTSASFAASLSTGAKLTSDLGIKAGGTNGTTRDLVERFSDSGNAWTSRTALNETKQGPSGIGLTTDVVIVAAGHNGTSYSILTDRYSDSGNSWTAVATKPASSQNCDAFKISDNLAITAGGKNSVRLTASDKFHNTENTWSVRTPMNKERSRVGEFATGSSQGICCGGRDELGSYVGTTERFTDTYTSEAINPYYKLRLKFNLYRDIQGDSWVLRTNVPSDIGYHGSFSLNSNQGLQFGGDANGGGTWLNTSYRYTDDSNSWLSRATLSYGGQRMGFGLTSDFGLSVAGWNGSARNHAERYSDSANTWLSRTAANRSRYAADSYTMTTNTGLVATGHNGSGREDQAERYTDSLNSWTSRTSATEKIYKSRGFPITTDLGMLCGGDNGSNSNAVRQFSESGNSWSTRNSMSTYRLSPGNFSLNSNTGILSAGYSTITSSEKYYNTTNIWLIKGNVSEGGTRQGGFSLSGFQGMACGGEKSNRDSAERYTDGETSLSGFAVQTLK